MKIIFISGGSLDLRQSTSKLNLKQEKDAQVDPSKGRHLSALDNKGANFDLMDWQKETAGFFKKHRNIKFVKVLCKQIK